MSPQISVTNDNQVPAKPNPLEIMAEWRHNDLIQYLQSLIPLLDELNLIGSFHLASGISSVARNHRARLKGRSYKAQELVEAVMEYESLEINSISVKASVEPDWNGRKRAYIQFAWTNKTTDSGKLKDSEISYCKKRDVMRDEDRECIGTRLPRLTGWRAIEEEQKAALLYASQNRDPNDVPLIEDPELFEHLAKLMEKGRSQRLNPKPNVIENGI